MRDEATTMMEFSDELYEEWLERQRQQETDKSQDWIEAHTRNDREKLTGEEARGGRS